MQQISNRSIERLVRIRKKNERIVQRACKENTSGKNAGLEPADFLERIRNVDRILEACRRAI